MEPTDILSQFDRFLAERGLALEAIVIGGAALALLGVISRQTRDCDVLYPQLPDAIKEAASEFATQVRQQGDVLADDWLNNGPSLLADVLPEGWARSYPDRLLRSRLTALHSRPDGFAPQQALCPL
jgi:hypothetical protein